MTITFTIPKALFIISFFATLYQGLTLNFTGTMIGVIYTIILGVIAAVE